MEAQIIELLLGGETILNAVILVALVNILNRLKNKINLGDKLESLKTNEKVQLVATVLGQLADDDSATTEDARELIALADQLRPKAYLEPSDT